MKAEILAIAPHLVRQPFSQPSECCRVTSQVMSIHWLKFFFPENVYVSSGKVAILAVGEKQVEQESGVRLRII
jgi:hypothetical protein